MDDHQRWEVEQKYRVKDVNHLQQGLAELGFVEARRIEQSDQYFRHPCRDFRKTGEAFRLRRDGEKCVVTYKGPRTSSEVKTRPEIELELVPSELDRWEELLAQLGFQALPPVQKHRVVYRPPVGDPAWHEMTVTIDDAGELGRFAEIEIVVKRRDALHTAQQRVQELARSLQLEQIEPRSYLVMALEKWGIE